MAHSHSKTDWLIAAAKPDSKIIDCGPVGPLMMDLSPSCREGASPYNFKEPKELYVDWSPFTVNGPSSSALPSRKD